MFARFTIVGNITKLKQRNGIFHFHAQPLTLGINGNISFRLIDHQSWYAHAIRDGWLSDAKIALNKNLNFIKVLVAICPMLGLLGTVTGMISVFDVMATQGSSQPRLMASGISLATLPTMAGMVAALAGMFIYARLAKACQMRELKLISQPYSVNGCSAATLFTLEQVQPSVPSLVANA